MNLSTTTLKAAPSTQDTPKEVQDAIERAMKEARERINSIDLSEHWKESIDYLDENFAFFLTHVLNMGKPEWEYGIKTAAVALPMTGADMTDFRYLFNPVFAALLEPEEFAFIEAHETMHVLLNHLKLLERGKKVGKFKDSQKFNVAADCVINDYLTSMGLEAGRFRKLGCFGEDIVKYNCANATVSEVYLDIPDEMGEGGDGEGGGEADGQGNCGGGLGEYMKGSSKSSAMGDHDWMHNPDDAKKQGDAADQIGKNTPGVPKDIDDKKQDDDHKGTPGAGPGSEAGAMRNFIEQKGVSMRWAELLKKVDPDFFKSGGPRPRPSFHTPRRKMMGVYEKYPQMGVLPVMAEPKDPKGETPSIVMFMDGSGSCSDWIQNFATLAKSVPPEKIKLIPYSFSTYTQAFDLAADNPKLASGGTSFSPIEECIQREIVPDLGHYPKAVVVMTDLEGNFPSTKPKKEDQHKWLWLATHGGRYDYRGNDKFGETVPIEEFCDGMKEISQVRSRGY